EDLADGRQASMDAHRRGARMDAALQRLSDSIDPGSLLEATPECLAVIGSDGRIVFVNHRLLELTGSTRGDLDGRPVDVLIPGWTGDPVARQRFEAVCRRSDGVELPVEVHVGEIDGTERFLVVTIRDVSDLQAGREARFEAEAKFRALVEQISAITYTWTWRDDK